MTDRTPHDAGDVDRPDDELVSAVLDGEASPEDVARVEADPGLRARLATFDAVRASVQPVGDQPEDQAAAQLVAALEEFATIEAALALPLDGPDTDDEDPGVVTPLAEVRRAWWQRVPLGAVAAAVAVIALIGAIGLNRGDDGVDTASRTLDSSAGSVSDAADGGDDLAVTTADEMAESAPLAADEAAGATAAEAFGAASRPDFASTDDLASYLREELARRSDDAGETGDTEVDDPTARVGPEDPCSAVELLELDPVTVELVASVTVAGSPATAVVHGPGEELRLVLVDDSTCEVLEDRPLER